MLDLAICDLVAGEIDALEVLQGGEVLKAGERAFIQHQHLEIIQLFDELFQLRAEFAYLQVAQLQAQDFCLLALGFLDYLPDLRYDRTSVFTHFWPLCRTRYNSGAL